MLLTLWPHPELWSAEGAQMDGEMVDIMNMCHQHSTTIDMYSLASATIALV